MKKSTLITTIAMIVVVVVALSTATYAWFTSSAVTTATVEMHTTATSNLSLTVVNNVQDSTHSWADGATGIGIALTANSGLWAPEAAITNKLAYTTSTLTGLTDDFYPADFKTAGTQQAAATATQNAAATTRGMDAIRVSNITGDTLSTVYLYIIIAVDGGAANSNNLYAAQATSFYVSIAAKTGDPTYATNGYGLGTAAAHTYVKADTFDDSGDTTYVSSTGEAVEQPASAEAFAAGEYYVDVAGFGKGAIITQTTSANAAGLSVQENFGGTGKNTLNARPAYDGQTTGGFILAGRDVESLGITSGQYVLAYRISLGSLAANDSLTLGAYNWIDGWYADNAAGNASYTVTYAFTDSIQTIS